MLGRTISHYRIQSQVGTGGMGVVYRALDTQLNRYIALKFLPPNALKDISAKERFIQEAQAASALDHPNVCTIHEIGETDEGELFIAMAFYQGKDLRSKLKVDPISIEESLGIARQVAEGLSEVHAQEIVHRDIKPANLFVLDSGPVKILDFGLAKLAGSQSITRTGTTLGTVNYMSPEQAGNSEVDHRTDIWSLGVVLYEMLTGSVPFRGMHEAAILHSVIYEDPVAPSQVNPLIPSALDQIVLKCLQKDPGDRFTSADDFLAALSSIEKGAAPQKEKPTATSPWFRYGVLASLVLLIAFGLLDPLKLWRSGKSDGSYSPSVPTTGNLPQIRQISVTGSAFCPIWSPDGKTIAYSDAGKIQICSPTGSHPRTLELESGSAVTWNFAPDSESILVHGSDTDFTGVFTWQVSLFGASPQVLLTDGVYADFSPDQKSVVYSKVIDGSMRSIYLRNLDTGAEHPVITTTEPGTALYKPQWDPDQEHIAYIRWNGYGHELWYCNIDGSGDHQLDLGPMHVGGHFCFSSDGQWLVFAGSLDDLWSIWKVHVDGGKPIRMTDPTEYTYHASLSPDQNSVVFTRGRELSQIIVLDLETLKTSSPFKLTVAARNPVIDPTGESLFFQALVNGTWQIWAGPTQSNRVAQPVIAVDHLSCAQPQIDAAGNLYHIRSDLRPSSVFGDVKWNRQLFKTSLDGGNLFQLPEAGGRVSRLEGSKRNDRGLLFSMSEGEGTESIHLLSPDGSVIELLRDSDDFSFYSFDWGRHPGEILLSHDVSDSNGTVASISALDIDSGERTVLFNASNLQDQGIEISGQFYPFELADNGNTLIFVSTEIASRQPVIICYDFQTGKAQIVYRAEGKESPQGLAISPDGKLTAIGQVSSQIDIFIAEGLAP